MIDILKKINFLITKRQRKGLVILTLLLFVGMILEVFGLGVLVPAISIILDPGTIDKTPFISDIRGLLSDFSNQSFTFLFLGAIILVYFVKSAFIVLLTHKQNRFLSNITAYISNNLFASYLSQHYSFHLNRNAAGLLKNIQVEIYYLYIFLLSLITIIIEGGFIFSVLSTLVYIEPFGAICIGVFYGLLSIFFLQFTKQKIKVWGLLREEIDEQVSKIALEGLGGIKDSLILGKTDYFIKQYTRKNYVKARLNANQGTISQIPRFYLEFISIVGLVSFISLMLLQEKDTTSLFTTLGVFVAATFRMIPSLNRIIASTQSLKYYLPSVDIIHKEIESCSEINIYKTNNEKVDFNNQIEFKKLNFSFKKGVPILTDIDFSIKKGETIGIIGESGSGKSTLVDLIIGLHIPDSGEIVVDGSSNVQFKQSWRNQIGYVSQSIYLMDDTIESNIAFGISTEEIDNNQIEKVLRQVQLFEFVKTLELGVKTRVGERGVQLSGGQRQRIGIARALYHDPQILILDEATSALDSETEKEVMNSIDNLKNTKTILMIAHRLTTLKSCESIYSIVRGCLSKKDIN